MGKRIIGSGLILIGILGVVMSIAGIIVGGQAVDSLGQILSNTITTTQTNLTTVEDTLKQAKTTLKNVNQTLQTTQEGVLDASQALSQTRPLLDQAGQIASQKIPDNLDAVKATLPSIAAAGVAVETTLTQLSDFKVDQPFLGRQLTFDLGITYEPPQPPIEQSLAQVETNLGRLASSFRLLEKDLQASSQNVARISRDLETLGQNLEQVNHSLAGFDLLLDEYLRIVDDFQTGLERLQENLAAQLAPFKLGMMIFMIWLALTNLTPLYLGWELLHPVSDPTSIK